MKTRYLFGAIAALAMAACSQDEVVNVKQDGIGYSVTAATQTRAADSYCNSALPNYFKVWAETTDDELYINGDKVVNNNGVWSDANGTHYWPENKTLNFYAEVNGDDKFSFNSGAPTFNNFTVEDDVAKQVDLMYAVNTELAKTDQSTPTVQLNFRHALSQVCFKARNNTKNMRVEIKGVSVGHLTNSGTFTFPTIPTNENYVNHSDATGTATLNSGTWTIPASATYSKKYEVTPLNGSVTLAPGSSVTNLTCPDDDHKNGFAQVLTLLPQTVAAWDPGVTGTDYNGAYFLLDVVLYNITKDDNESEVATTMYTGKTAVPVSVAWQQGYRYIYTFVFGEGGNGGYTPTPDNPQPVLASINYDVTVDDFIPVSPDGGVTDMSTCTALDKSNSYIINTSGSERYSVPISQINMFWSSTDGDGTTPISNETQWVAEVIWQDQAERMINFYNEDGSINSSGSYIGGEKFYFKYVGEKEGNVLIGVRKSSESTYLWSWHLWITNYNPDEAPSAWTEGQYTYEVTGGTVQRYDDGTESTIWADTYNDKFIMDRNLGAMSASPSDGYKTYGMYYQFGRKDPFPYYHSTNAPYLYDIDGTAKSNIENQNGTDCITHQNGSAENLALAVKNPTTFYYPGSKDWVDNNTYKSNLWNNPSWNESDKSLFDPCPAGWKLPEIGTWDIFVKDKDVNASGNWASGWNFIINNDGTETAWYPATGNRRTTSGAMYNVSSYGDYWSSSTENCGDGHGRSLLLGPDYVFRAYNNDFRGYGFAVRCIRE